MTPWAIVLDTTTLITYSIAAIVLVIAPGPGQALVLARAVERGTRAGLLTAVGLEVGTLVHTFAAAVGVSAIVATSATAFTTVKYAGAAYLVLLGGLAIGRSRHAVTVASLGPDFQSVSGSRLVIQAAITGVLNPKVAVFFLAFLPQFVDPARGLVLVQFAVLGVLLASFGLVFDAMLSMVAGRARDRMIGSARFAAWRERLTGTVMIGLGLRLALAERRS